MSLKARAAWSHAPAQERYVSNPVFMDQMEQVDSANSNTAVVASYPAAAPARGFNRGDGGNNAAARGPNVYAEEEVWCSRRTVREGDRAIVWQHTTGQVYFVDGPARPFLYRSRMGLLRQYTAEASQYLSVRRLDGQRQVVRGPASMHFNPLEHASIVVENAITLNADEIIVVVNGQSAEEAGASDTPTRAARERIVRGPCVYFPEPSDWIREFTWGRNEEAAGTRLSKLRSVPESVRITIDNIRTNDDIVLVEHFEITIQLVSVERMLLQSHDPVKELTNALVADVVTLSSKLSFDELRASLDVLNTATAYGHLRERAELIGFNVVAVAFRGYEFGTPALAQMRARTVETRARLAIEAEETEQSENLMAMRQQKEAERARDRRAMEAEQAAHALRLGTEAAEARLANERAATALALENERLRAEQQLAALRALHASGVDLTALLVAQAEGPSRPDSFMRFRFDGLGADGAKAPQVHLHQGASK